MMTSENEKSLVSSLTKEEKIKKIHSYRILHPDFQHCLKLIRMCHDSKLTGADPQCLLITGNYGSGKTTIFETYLKEKQKIVPLESTTKVTILSGSIPSPTRINTFLEAMLSHLGDPYPVRGTIGNKHYRLVRLIKDSEVELMVLDEFQHFVNTESQRINHDVADCFKSIINETKVPVVLLGLEESEKVLQVNGQLKRRFSLRYHIKDFGTENKQRADQFRFLLHQIDKGLPFEKLSGLKEVDMWGNFVAATKGNMNSIMKLIRQAALFAVEENQDQIKKEHYKKAFDLHSFILHGKNPF